jgi:hypothetical protein
MYVIKVNDSYLCGGKASPSWFSVELEHARVFSRKCHATNSINQHRGWSKFTNTRVVEVEIREKHS